MFFFSKVVFFAGKVITDLGCAYELKTMRYADIMVNNLFHVYPDEIDTKVDLVTDLGGSFIDVWEVNQFGFSVTTFPVGPNFKF